MLDDTEISDHIPLEGSMTMITTTDFARLEKKVDKLASAMDKLILVEERQSNQNLEIAEMKMELKALHQKTDSLERKVES